MATPKRATVQHLPDIKIGAVTFYNAVVEVIYGQEYVRFSIGSDAVLAKEGGIVENNGKQVTMDRRSWDSMVAAQVKEAA